VLILDIYSQIDKFVGRLWQQARLRAADAPESVQRSGAALVRKAVEGLNPVQDRELIATALSAHVLEHTARLYGRPGCITCSSVDSCQEEDSRSCGLYEKDPAAYDVHRLQLLRAVKSLDRVFGVEADRLAGLVDDLLNDLKVASGRLPGGRADW
jgi:hypothetical protein